MEGISEPIVCWCSGVAFARFKTPSRMPALLLCTSASLHMQPPMHRLAAHCFSMKGFAHTDICLELPGNCNSCSAEGSLCGALLQACVKHKTDSVRCLF